MTSRESFYGMNSWLKQINENAPKDLVKCIAGNKIDLEDERVINEDEIKDYAEANKAEYLLTSAYSGNGIDDIFKNIVSQVEKKESESYYDNSPGKVGKKDDNQGESLVISNRQQKSKGKCCNG